MRIVHITMLPSKYIVHDLVADSEKLAKIFHVVQKTIANK